MSGEMQTPIDRPYAQQPETRAAAVRVIAQEPDSELLLQALGLVDSGPLVIGGKVCCPVCCRPYNGDGRTSCRRLKCPAGPSSRSKP